MSEQQSPRQIPGSDQVAIELRFAVHAGEVGTVQRLLRDNPALVTAQFVGLGAPSSDAD